MAKIVSRTLIPGSRVLTNGPVVLGDDAPAPEPEGEKTKDEDPLGGKIKDPAPEDKGPTKEELAKVAKLNDKKNGKDLVAYLNKAGFYDGDSVKDAREVAKEMLA